MDPILTFSVGYLFYWLFPVVLGTSGAFAEQPGMGLWYDVFRRVPPSTLVLYVLIVNAVYLAFVAGYTRSAGRNAGLPTPSPVRFVPNLLGVLFVPLLALAALASFLLRSEFFRGYTTESILTETGIRGAFVAISSGLLGLALLRYSARALTRRKSIVRSIPSDLFFVVYFLVAILVASLGGRLYLVSALLMIAAYRSAYERRIGYRAFLIGSLVAAGGAAIIGIVRLGMGVNETAVLFNLAAEPLFTSFSLLSFLVNNHPDLLRIPVFLASDFANLIPTALFPGKAALLRDPNNYGFPVLAPLGALNSYFSFMINFGALGTIAALYAGGAWLGRLRQREGSPVARTAYSMITGWAAFTLFRDPFSVSIVKNIFEFSILLPAIFASLAHVLSVVASPLERTAAGGVGAR